MNRISLWLGTSDPPVYGLALNWAPVMQGHLDYVSARSGECSSSSGKIEVFLEERASLPEQK